VKISFVFKNWKPQLSS